VAERTEVENLNQRQVNKQEARLEGNHGLPWLVASLLEVHTG
jgi:hypothetical protein